MKGIKTYIYEVNKNDEDLPSIEFSGPNNIKTSDGIEFVREPNSTRFDLLSYVYKFPNKDGLRLYTTGKNNPVYIEYIGHHNWPVRDKFENFEEAAIHALHLYNKYKKKFKY